jgi:hypothetical protein
MTSLMVCNESVSTKNRTTRALATIVARQAGGSIDLSINATSSMTTARFRAVGEHATGSSKHHTVGAKDEFYGDGAVIPAKQAFRGSHRQLM